MNVKTREGIKIDCLPDNAKCKLANENPLCMLDGCPICNFDFFGWECIPELCDEYTEE